MVHPINADNETGQGVAQVKRREIQQFFCQRLPTARKLSLDDGKGNGNCKHSIRKCLHSCRARAAPSPG